MSITYPVAWPSGIRPSNLQIKPLSAVAVSESPFTYAQQVYAWPGQRWTAEMEIGPLTKAQGSTFRAFLLSLNGREGTFYFNDPTATEPRGTALGTPLVDGADQTGSTLSTKGWTASQTGALLAGDYIQLGSGSNSTLYQVVQDVDADGAGDADIEIWPDLRSSPADEAAITLENCKGVFRLKENEMAWALSSPDIHSFTLGIVEAL